jgi:hypothetical protein
MSPSPRIRGYVKMPVVACPITGKKVPEPHEIGGAQADNPFNFDLEKYLAKLLKNESHVEAPIEFVEFIDGKKIGDSFLPGKKATTLDLIREHVIGIQLDGSPLCGNYEKFAHMEANFQMSKWAIKWRVSRQMLREQARQMERDK